MKPFCVLLTLQWDDYSSSSSSTKGLSKRLSLDWQSCVQRRCFTVYSASMLSVCSCLLLLSHRITDSFMSKWSILTTVENGQMNQYHSKSAQKNCAVQLDRSGLWKTVLGSLRLEGSSGNCLVQALYTQQFELEEFSQCHIESDLNTIKNGGSTTMLCN